MNEISIVCSEVLLLIYFHWYFIVIVIKRFLDILGYKTAIDSYCDFGVSLMYLYLCVCLSCKWMFICLGERYG